MSADLLRRAAADMRADYPACTHDQSERPRPCEHDLPFYHQDAATYNAVADWLIATAEKWERHGISITLCATEPLAVACAYLGRDA